MADTVQTKWIYPPNWTGSPPETGGNKRIVVQYTGNFGVGTSGETREPKLDISELRTPTGEIATRFAIEKIEYNVTGMQNVLLEWDVRPYEKVAVLSGASTVDFSMIGGAVTEGGGGTGDLLLTTNGAADGSGYDIVLVGRPKGD